MCRDNFAHVNKYCAESLLKCRKTLLLQWSVQPDKHLNYETICVFTNINLDAYVIVCVATVIVVYFCVEKCVMCLCIVCMCVLESLES